MSGGRNITRKCTEKGEDEDGERSNKKKNLGRESRFNKNEEEQESIVRLLTVFFMRNLLVDGSWFISYFSVILCCVVVLDSTHLNGSSYVIPCVRMKWEIYYCFTRGIYCIACHCLFRFGNYFADGGGSFFWYFNAF